ncbi:DUF4114 domain-containing protein [Terasakiella sp. SH-1]|uniref:DUF4114 domain-containing protein n=1 Tax=Terasakiella sp. SH-1 TaxID=2560057 RepID=UPI001073151D|nr:DUF4114 domain-containing protein [Terasakiella sp. SH-1]
MRMTYHLAVSSIGIVFFTQVAQAQEAITHVELEDGLLSSIQTALPERSNVDMDFLNPSYDPTIRFSQDTQVGVTFIDEGAGYRNSLGYFTFNDNTFDNLSFGDIDTNNNGMVTIGELSNLNGVNTGMIFNNASKAGGGGNLRAGDTVVLGGGTAIANGTDFSMENGTTFSSGTNMGFFLLQNAYSRSGVNENAMTMYSVDFLNPENTASATYDDVAGNSRHVAMMFTDYEQDELVLAYEDLYRNAYSDEDFNDAVFRIRTDPVEAISGTNVTIMAAPAPGLGGGLAGLIGLTGVFALTRRKRSDDQ